MGLNGDLPQPGLIRRGFDRNFIGPWVGHQLQGLIQVRFSTVWVLVKVDSARHAFINLCNISQSFSCKRKAAQVK